MTPHESNPHLEYQSRLEARQRDFNRLTRLHITLGNLRLLLAILFAVLAWAAFGRKTVSPWWLSGPGAGFLSLAVYHEYVIRNQKRAGRAVKFYERAIARLEDRWSGTGPTGERFLDPHHPFAADLDLFGDGGLFQLLSVARTRMGEETLANWLLAPAGLAVVKQRQAAVADLRDRLDLREDLAVLGAEIQAGVHPQQLATWAEEEPLLNSRPARWVAAALAALFIVSLFFLPESPLFSISVLVVESGFALTLTRRVRRVVVGVEQAAHDLALLSRVLLRVEKEPFKAPHLMRLQTAFQTKGPPPSQQIARLSRLAELLDSGKNLFMKLLGPPVLYTTQLAFAVEAWRLRCGPMVRHWLEAAGEIEALSSLAGYAYEHPSDPFPEFATGSTCFDGRGLGHPLLPVARCIRNDVKLGDDRRVLVVSGSNMSGKSTLLRTVGINATLAMAGSPVRAARLILSPLSVGASIRVTDSLQQGSSRFYAEITRLRLLLDMTDGPAHLLFLIDELLHGTNSHDRSLGAEGIIRGLVERRAIGLVTTHDLALARIADQVLLKAGNVHFEDHIEDGKISFDYKLRPGVVQKSNALELMRSIGLEV